jgi:hypothetical protein
MLFFSFFKAVVFFGAPDVYAPGAIDHARRYFDCAPARRAGTGGIGALPNRSEVILLVARLDGDRRSGSPFGRGKRAGFRSPG